jgi:hypothetical protein
MNEIKEIKEIRYPSQRAGAEIINFFRECEKNSDTVKKKYSDFIRSEYSYRSNNLYKVLSRLSEKFLTNGELETAFGGTLEGLTCFRTFVEMAGCKIVADRTNTFNSGVKIVKRGTGTVSLCGI